MLIQNQVLLKDSSWWFNKEPGQRWTGNKAIELTKTDSHA